jgi:hypothetical protein
LLNIPELWVSEAFQDFLSEYGAIRELNFSINCNESTVQKNSQGAYDPASGALED